MNYTERHEAQVAHITEYIERFHDHTGDDDVSSYLIDFAGASHDIYQRLCADLEIEPNQAICHPDPYGETPP